MISPASRATACPLSGRNSTYRPVQISGASSKLGRPKIDSIAERKVRKELAKGVGILKIAKSLGIGTGTVQRIANELR